MTLRSTSTSRALALGLALGIVAGGAQADGEDKPVKDMQKAWNEYSKVVKETIEDWQETPQYEDDPVGAYDLLAGFMTTNFRSHINSSGASFRGRPRFAGFDDPDTRIGIDNPDTQYMAAAIPNGDGQNVYRVFGNRSNSLDMILQWFDSTSSTGGGATLEDEDLVVEPDGSYEVYLSTPELRDNAWANWLEIPASDGLTIQRRHSHCDWSVEVPGEVHIERVGTAGVPIPADVYSNPEVMTRQIEFGTSVLANQGSFWSTFAQNLKTQLPPNFIFGWAPTGTIGITTQLSFTAWAQIPEGMALIITLPEAPAQYYGFQLFNFWGSSLPWADRQVSLSWGVGGTCQAQQTSDGNYYIVVSAEDPGVQNWVDTMGREEVGMAGRLQSVDPADFGAITDPASIYKPQTQLVAIEDVLSILPPDTNLVTEEERAAQLEERQNFVREKYVFW